MVAPQVAPRAMSVVYVAASMLMDLTVVNEISQHNGTLSELLLRPGSRGKEACS